jgi:hypothetical protein
MLMALPLLPANKIEEGLQIIERLAATYGLDFDGFRTVCSRLRDHWIGVIGTEVISVYKKTTRTNNGLESSFRKLNSLLKAAHKNLYTLLSKYYSRNKIIIC